MIKHYSIFSRSIDVSLSVENDLICFYSFCNFLIKDLLLDSVDIFFIKPVFLLNTLDKSFG